MANKDDLTYWQLRAIRNEQQSHDDANAKVEVLIKAYLRAQKYLTGETQKIYQRYFTGEDMTEEQVANILNTRISPSELVTLRALSENVTDKQSKIEVKDYLSKLAAKGRITQLEELQAKAYISAKSIASVELEQSNDLYTKVVKDAWNQAQAEEILAKSDVDITKLEKNYVPELNQAEKTIKIVNPDTGKTIKEVKALPDKQIKLDKQLSDKYVKSALDQKWHGASYSERIWNNTDKLSDKLQELFTSQQMSGMSERDMAKALSDEFGSGMANAKRLIRTEANYFHNTTKVAGWKQRGIKEFQIVAVLDNRTSQICRRADGKVYPVSEAQVGKTLPPLHVYCRSVAVVHFANSPYKGTRTANNPNTGKTFQIDQAKTYQDWEKIINDTREKQNGS